MINEEVFVRKRIWNNMRCYLGVDHLCGVVVRLPVCRPRGPGFDSRRCQIFCSAVGLERGPLSPYEDEGGATSKENSGSGLDNWDYGPCGIRRADHPTPLYTQKLALKFYQQLAVAQSVYFTCGLKDKEFVCLFVCLFVIWVSPRMYWGNPRRSLGDMAAQIKLGTTCIEDWIFLTWINFISESCIIIKFTRTRKVHTKK
jgi:hypothetical protein